jgi:hypothetical protein
VINHPIIQPVATAITEPVATLASERAQLVADLEATLQKLAELTAWAEQAVAA